MSSTKRNSVLAVLTLTAIFSFSFIAKVNTLNQVPLCLFKFITHLDCPGCGLTRSFISISHGNFWEALRFNILGPLIYLYLLFYLIKHILFLVSDASISLSWKMPPYFQWSFGILFVTQWLWKIIFGLGVI